MATTKCTVKLPIRAQLWLRWLEIEGKGSMEYNTREAILQWLNKQPGVSLDKMPPTQKE